MDSFDENYIKLEQNAIEEEFITVIPPTPNAEGESLLEEHGYLTNVKNEPISDEGSLNTITTLGEPVLNDICNSSSNSNLLTNTFVIYELEPHADVNFHLQDHIKTQNIATNTTISQTLPLPRLLNTNNQSNIVKHHPTSLRRRTSKLVEPKLLNCPVKPKINMILNTRRKTKSDQTIPKSTNQSKNAKHHPTPSRRLTSNLVEPKLLNCPVKPKINIILNTRRNTKFDKTIPKSTFEKQKIASKPATPPILLNTQLRKRSKLTGSINTETNLSNKKTCYNLQGAEIPKVHRTPQETVTNIDECVETSPMNCDENSLKSGVKESHKTKATNKKIINYIMQKKRVERIKKNRMDETKHKEEQSVRDLQATLNKTITHSSTLVKNPVDQQNPEDIVVKAENLDDHDTNGNTLIHSATMPIQTSVHVLENDPIKEESVESYILDQLNTIQMPVANTNLFSTVSTTLLTTSDSIDKMDTTTCSKNRCEKSVKSYTLPAKSSPVSKSNIQMTNSETPTCSKTRSEIKVKCLCRLTGDSSSDGQSSTAQNEELKDLFYKMFLVTKCLNKQQQRTVKMSLLQAICEAEEMVERGKCCCF